VTIAIGRTRRCASPLHPALCNHTRPPITTFPFACLSRDRPADAAGLSNLEDRTVMVVDCGRTGGGDLGGEVLGVALNRMGPSADGCYYYHSY
jgi:hypothetical protein